MLLQQKPFYLEKCSHSPMPLPEYYLAYSKLNGKLMCNICGVGQVRRQYFKLTLIFRQTNECDIVAGCSGWFPPLWLF